jgi:hypothetical protein
MPAPNLTLVTGNGEPARAPAPPPGAWLEAWSHAVGLGWDCLDTLAALGDLRPLRSAWLADMRQMTADYMRSTEFLSLMKLNLTLLAPPATRPARS